MSFIWNKLWSNIHDIALLKEGQISLVKIERNELAATIRQVQDQPDESYVPIGDPESPGGVLRITKETWLAENEPILLEMDNHIAELEKD